MPWYETVDAVDPVAEQLWDEAPARAWDWLCKVRDTETVFPLHQLNPVLVSAITIRRDLHKAASDPSRKPPQFHDEPSSDWRQWLARDGRNWDHSTRIPYDSPLAGVPADRQPRLAGQGGLLRAPRD